MNLSFPVLFIGIGVIGITGVCLCGLVYNSLRRKSS